MKKLIVRISLLFVSMILMLESCKKEVVVPENPYDKIDYGNNVVPTDTLNPSSIAGLHRNLFLTKCAVPGCHDGNFEPDFRTVQSSYSTLVYAPIKKNNAANTFTFRVIPGDTAFSVLYERITNCCFVNIDDRMPQDNIGTALPASDINHVATWIMNGAKDINGNTPNRPDQEPVLSYYVAAGSDFTTELSAQNNRVDSIIYNPFLVPANATSFYLAPSIVDDITPLAQIQYNKLLLSTSIDNFSSAVQLTATFVNIPNQSPVWLVSVPTENLTHGTQYFMRYYVNDGTHSENTEFPKNNSLEYYKTYWSFIYQ
jgi:hypothetical protein